jgi:hypothetical protein
MSLIAKQLFINKLFLPKDIVDVIKDYLFRRIQQISEYDERYDILLTIPYKEYDLAARTMYVYLNISQEKDYFLVYKNLQVELLTLGYRGHDNNVYLIERSICNRFSIEN